MFLCRLYHWLRTVMYEQSAVSVLPELCISRLAQKVQDSQLLTDALPIIPLALISVWS